MPQTVTITATKANTTKAIEYSRDGGTTWQSSNVFTGVPAGSIAGSQFRARLVGTAISDAWETAVVVSAAPAPFIVFGDSLNTAFIQGGGYVGDTVPQLTKAALAGDARLGALTNYAEAGDTTAGISGQIAAYLASTPADLATAVIVLQGGINDCIESPTPTAQQVYDRIAANVAQLYDGGARRIVVDGLTSATADYGPITGANLTTLRLAINTLLRENILGEDGVLGFLDSSTSAALGYALAGKNTTYFYGDEIHYTTPVGRELKAEQFYAPGVLAVLDGETAFTVTAGPLEGGGGAANPDESFAIEELTIEGGAYTYETLPGNRKAGSGSTRFMAVLSVETPDGAYNQPKASATFLVNGGGMEVRLYVRRTTGGALEQVATYTTTDEPGTRTFDIPNAAAGYTSVVIDAISGTGTWYYPQGDDAIKLHS